MTDNVGKRRCEKAKQMDEENYIRTDERTDGEHAADLAPGNATEERAKARRGFRTFLAHPGRAVTAVIFIVALVSIAASTLFAVSPDASFPPVYAIYAVAALSLAWAAFLSARGFGRLKAAAKARLARSEKFGRLMDDYALRTTVFSFISFALAALYAVMNGVLSVLYSSVWYGVTAGYWLSLCAVRIIVTAAGVRAEKSEDVRRARLKVFLGCGIALMVMETTMAGAITLRLISDIPVAGNMIAAISSAAYTFAKVIMAAVNLVKAGRIRNPVAQALRAISLTDALMSLFTLATTMIATFGDGTDMIGLTASLGFSVCAATLGMGVFMTVRAAILLRRGE